MTIRGMYGRVGAGCAAVLVLMFWAAPLLAADILGAGATVPVEATNNVEMLRSFLLLQEQIHDLQVKLESTRLETSASAQSNSIFVASKLQAMEDALRAQRAREVETLRATNSTIMMVAAGFAGFGLLIMVLMAYFQWRTINRVTEISGTLGPAHLLASGAAASLAGGAPHLLPPVVEQSSARLQDALRRIEERLHDLEGNGGATSGGANGQQATSQEGKGDLEGANGSRISAFLAKGQSLLSTDRIDEALALFEEALKLEPDHPETLVKKGMALERSGRAEAALECYERAIALEPGLTVAYLCKGGLCNRMQRFSEAVQCYEKALRAQTVAL